MARPRFHLICNIERNKYRRLMAGPAEPRDAEGPAGTTGCACVSRDAAECHRRRYGIVAGDVSHGAEECECLCHEWDEDDRDFTEQG